MPDESTTAVADVRPGVRAVLRALAIWAWTHPMTVLITSVIIANGGLPK